MSADLDIGYFSFPFVKQHGERLVELGCGLPAGCALHLCRIADHPSLLRLAQTAGVLLDANLHARNRGQSMQQRPDTLFATGTYVVYLATPAFAQKREIRAHYVAYVGEVARHVNVADFNHRLAFA